MSLMLAFKKAYTKVFNGKETGLKAFAAVATAITVPVGSAIMFSFGGDYSEQRTPVLGDKQYQQLLSEIDPLAEKSKKLDWAVQELLFNPTNAQLKEKLEAQQQYQVDFRMELNREMEDFKTRLLLSEGISEKDAIVLVDMVESKTDYTLSPNDRDFRQRMQYLDECQGQARAEALQKGSTFSEQGKMVTECQLAKMDRKEIGAGFFLGFLGIPASAVFLAGMSSLGAAFRRQIPNDEQRLREQARSKEKNEGPKPVTTTMKVTYTPSKN